MVDQQAGPVRAAGGETPAAGAGHRWLVLALVLVAQFMVVLDATIVTRQAHADRCEPRGRRCSWRKCDISLLAGPARGPG